MKNRIQVASAIILNKNSDLLVVRKCASSFYMLPGGKIEKGESLIDALLRELNEELGIPFQPTDFCFEGTFEAEAVNEVNTIVEGNLFLLRKPLHVEPINHFAEIEEVLWLEKDSYQDYQLAHLLKEFALPLWLADVK